MGFPLSIASCSNFFYSLGTSLGAALLVTSLGAALLVTSLSAALLVTSLGAALLVTSLGTSILIDGVIDALLVTSIVIDGVIDASMRTENRWNARNANPNNTNDEQMPKIAYVLSCTSGCAYEHIVIRFHILNSDSSLPF